MNVASVRAIATALLGFALILCVAPNCGGKKAGGWVTNYTDGTETDDGTGSNTSGILDDEDADKLFERSEGTLGITTFESQVDPYHMLVSMGRSVPLALIRSEDGVYEIEQTLSF